MSLFASLIASISACSALADDGPNDFKSNPLFFFSSRRPHTTSLRDWSSDVCSSDLDAVHEHAVDADRLGQQPGAVAREIWGEGGETGRASCREGVEISVVVGSLK